MTESAEKVTIESRGPVTVITLNRPEKRNALCSSMVASLDEILSRCERETSRRVLVLTGAGGAFSAGIDIGEQAVGLGSERAAGAVQGRLAHGSAAARLIWRLRRCPQPVIAAIDGIAAGAGLSLALAADLRVAAPTAGFSAAFVKLGASGGDMGSSYFLPRLVGWERAAELLYTGRRVGAEEALRIGLVSRLVGEGEASACALGLAEEICANAPAGTRLTKRLLATAMDGAPLEQMLGHEVDAQVLASLTEDFGEGVRAFVERRAAVYQDH